MTKKAEQVDPEKFKTKEFSDNFNATMDSNTMRTAKIMGVTVKQKSPDEFEVNIPLEYDWDEGTQAGKDIRTLIPILKKPGEVQKEKEAYYQAPRQANLRRR